MMTMPQIMETLKCARHSARRVVDRHNIEKIQATSKNGKKYLYKITPDELIKIKTDENEQRSKTSTQEQQDAALKNLLMLMG